MAGGVCGVVLAGGESKRFRERMPSLEDKSLYVYEGRPLVEWALEHLSEAAEGLVVSAGTRARAELLARYALKYNAKVVEDPPGVKGPLAGVLASLKVCDAAKALVLAVDVPRVPVGLLEEAVSRVDERTVVSVVTPTGLVASSVLALSVESGLVVVEELLARGRSGLTDVLRGFPDLYLLNTSRRRGWDLVALDLDYPPEEPLLPSPGAVFEEVLVGDVYIKRNYEVREIRATPPRSIWYTLATGDPLGEFALYAEHGVFMLAAKALLDARSEKLRRLGKLLLRVLRTTWENRR